MAEPKKRHTSTRSGNRRSHLLKKGKSFSVCAKCKEIIPSHRVCPHCGYYKGVDILKLEEKSKAKEERRKEKAKENE